MTFPKAPEKVTAFESALPPKPHEIGAQFAEHAQAIVAIINFLRTIVRDDGMLKNGIVGPEQLTRQLPELLAVQAMEAVNSLLSEAQASSSSARTAAAQTAEMARKMGDLARSMSQMLARVETLAEQVRTAQNALESYTLPHIESLRASPRAGEPVGVLGPNAGGFYGPDPQGATAVASDYAQVAIEWAEHMPDPIPPNILAINAITGDHWSSRWWANMAANAFGQMSSLYYGALPNPPVQNPNGGPIQTGAMYFNTTSNQLYIWNGTTWVASYKPQKSVTHMLFYLATANQTAFPTTANDIDGNNYTLNPDGSEGVEVYVNGVRLTIDLGASNGDFRVNAATSTITLLAGVAVNTMVGINVLASASSLTPGSVKSEKIQPLATFDGTTTTFAMSAVSGVTVAVTKSEELIVSLDGVQQEPGTQFTASGNSITFAQAPATDAYCFIVWFSKA